MYEIFVYLQLLYLFSDNVLNWSSTSGHGTAYQSNIDMIKGGYFITKSGIYLVRACVTFKVVQNHDRSVSYSIRRNNAASPKRNEEVLLTGKDYITGSPMTTCLGSYLQLVKGDNIYVKVSDPLVIYTHWWCNWFDIMKMYGPLHVSNTEDDQDKTQ